MRFLLAPLLVVVALAGCSSPPTPAPRPSPSVTSLFDSDEEALEAAKTTLAEYWRVSNLIMQEGGAEPQRLINLVAEEKKAGELDYAADMAKEGRIQVGEIMHRVDRMQQRYLTRRGDVVIVMQCLDYSKRTLYENGAAIDLSHVPPRRLFQTVLTAEGGRLVVKETEPWADDC